MTIDCPMEPYTYDGKTIVLPGIDTTGDCLHDELKKHSLTLKSISYDADKDEIHMEIGVIIFVTAKITLTH